LTGFFTEKREPLYRLKFFSFCYKNFIIHIMAFESRGGGRGGRGGSRGGRGGFGGDRGGRGGGRGGGFGGRGGFGKFHH
jgi:hypothetical protein